MFKELTLAAALIIGAGIYAQDGQSDKGKGETVKEQKSDGDQQRDRKRLRDGSGPGCKDGTGEPKRLCDGKGPHGSKSGDNEQVRERKRLRDGKGPNCDADSCDEADNGKGKGKRNCKRNCEQKGNGRGRGRGRNRADKVE